MRFRRMLCLALALLFFLGLVPGRTAAADTVYFTAVNEQLLPLNDETMPFWSGGALYVSCTLFENSELGIFYSRGRDKANAVLYRQRDALICDLSTGTIYDNSTKQTYSGSVITRGDQVFWPLDTVCQFFGLLYSYMRTQYGILIRVKNSAAVLGDTTFVDAASTFMAQRYASYERSKLPAEEAPAAAAETAREDEARRSVCFAVESTDAAGTEQLLSYFPARTATFLFTPEVLPERGDLLRRLAAGAGTIALSVEAAEGPEEALRQIEAGNRALWAAAACKTRLVYLRHGREDTARAVREAGYCPLRFSLDLSGSAFPAVSRAASRILSAADANSGACRVLLGTDTIVSSSLNTLLMNLRGSNCTPARLNELSALT